MKKEEYLDLYRQMVLIRRTEERAAELYQLGKIGGFLHLYIGQEAVSTGLYNREGILQTVSECIEHQDRILDALRRNEAESASRVARDFLVRMREYLGTRLVPDVGGPAV